MSDFLANLADRAMELEPEIAPRPPARFEPAGIAGDLQTPLFEREAIVSDRPHVVERRDPDVLLATRGVAPDPETVDFPLSASPLVPPPRVVSPPATGERPVPERRSDVPQPTAELPPVGGPTAWNAAHTAPAPARPGPVPRNEKDTDPLPAIAHRDREWEIPDVTIRESVQTRLSLDPRDDRSRTESLVNSNRTESIDPAPAPGPHYEPRGREERVRPTPRTAVSPQERLNPGDALPAAARLRPAPLPDTGERAERPTDTPLPTIQVTIGRVEVRAPAASAREARRAKANPSVLPLNDYLRRRKEGA